jgi:raffinose/stachyose/melibiose transport system permease protein
MTAPPVVSDPAAVAAQVENGKAPRRRRTPGVGGVRVPFWFVLPAVLGYAAVVLVPNIGGDVLSFTNWDGYTPDIDFVGFANFTRVLEDDNALRAIGNTFLLTIIVSLGQNLLGLLLALGLHSKVKTRMALRLVFFLPVVLTPIVVGYLWKYLLTPEGTVNQVLAAVGLENLQQDWLGNPNLALFSVCASIIWSGAGFSMVIYLAGLQAVPPELLEAAAIDGAGPVRSTISIVLPLINGAIVVNLLLAVLGNLKQFDSVFAMTNGGPAGSTETMATIVYKTAFLYLQYPSALAQGVVLTIVVGVIGFLQYRITQRKALA